MKGRHPIAIELEAVTSGFYDTEFSSALYGTLVLCGFVFYEKKRKECSQECFNDYQTNLDAITRGFPSSRE